MIQSLFPTQKTAINNFQNVISFAIYVTMTYYYFTDNFEPCHNILYAYLAFDVFFAQPDAILHHICCFTMLSCKNTYNLTIAEIYIQMQPLIKTEISSIFLIFKLVYENNLPDSIKSNRIAKVLYHINDLTFVTTFVKTRIWDLLFDAVLNPEIHRRIATHAGDYILRNFHFYSGFYGLYILNLYWFSLICKKMYKVLIINGGINDKPVKRVLPWTPFFALVPFFTISHMATHSIKNLAYIISIIMLSFASNAYYRNESDNAHITCFTCLIQVQSHLSLLAIGSEQRLSSAIIHVGGGLYGSNVIPLVFDAVCVICAIDDQVVRTQIGMTAAALAIVVKVKPLYELNDILVHLLGIMYLWFLVGVL
jgi:hypothetical protein